MAVLRVYLDDSGDADADDETHLTIGGWVADEDGWGHFENGWKALTHKFQVPYLHMKEFGNRKSKIYGHLKNDPNSEREFMQGVNSVIRSSARTSVATTAFMGEIEKFNRKNSLALDPYALCIYGCILQLRSHFPDDEIEFVLDKFDNSPSRAALALKYAASHTGGLPVKADLFTPILLQKDESWKTVLPLQAADLIAWEVRKHRRERIKFKPPKAARADHQKVHKLALGWDQAHAPRYRGNFAALVNSTLLQPRHSVVDFTSLEIGTKAHHPNGWV